MPRGKAEAKQEEAFFDVTISIAELVAFRDLSRQVRNLSGTSPGLVTQAGSFEQHLSDNIVSCAQKHGYEEYTLSAIRLWPIGSSTVGQANRLIHQPTTDCRGLSLPELAVVWNQSPDWLPIGSQVVLTGSTCGRQSALVSIHDEGCCLTKVMDDETGPMALAICSRQIIWPGGKQSRKPKHSGHTPPPRQRKTWRHHQEESEELLTKFRQL